MKKNKILGIAFVCAAMLSSVGFMAAENWRVSVSSQKFVVNSKPVKANALNINDNNYLKITEFAELLDIDVSFNENNNTVSLDKSKPFTGVKTVNNIDTSNKQEQIVKVDIKQLEAEQFEILDLVNIKNGDSITFDIKSNGKGGLFIGFTKDNNGKKPELTYYGDGDMFVEKGIIKKTFIVDEKEGEYYFYICNQGKETLKDIVGTVTIVSNTK